MVVQVHPADVAEDRVIFVINDIVGDHSRELNTLQGRVGERRRGGEGEGRGGERRGGGGERRREEGRGRGEEERVGERREEGRVGERRGGGGETVKHSSPCHPPTGALHTPHPPTGALRTHHTHLGGKDTSLEHDNVIVVKELTLVWYVAPSNHRAEHQM